jgi:hypothetical protein
MGPTQCSGIFRRSLRPRRQQLERAEDSNRGGKRKENQVGVDE